MIGESSYSKGDEALFDLIGDLQHIAMFDRTSKRLLKKGLHKENVTVAYVLEFMKREFPFFSFKACRAEGRSLGECSLNSNTYYFDSKKQYVLDLFHKAQICVYNQSFLASPYRIVYEKTFQGYV